MQQFAPPLNSSEILVRRSLRAKRLRVSISPVGEVEVVAPKNATTCDVQCFIQAQYSWISRKKQQIESVRNIELNSATPSSVILPAIEKQWDVAYDWDSRKTGIVESGVTSNAVLRLTIENENQACHMLKQWLTKKAVFTLLPWLRKISIETGLNFAKAKVRGQKTRWASCSSKKNINLNRCMLFLKPEQVRYLMVHELCHTKQMNHSAKFWALVGQHVPDYPLQEKLVNKGCYQLPRWVF